ncbi:hypothetical protein RHMOL_Rhmol06G0190500 [Rhododendron molle]|uniref:Uncharacterized protein n=1 Tax=Rhododendron molle TaxID=49168 RepID=A0ACC0NE36_RHOML|nr:hypothetical protein RHMOL_Rhmol06G0190500 [Rhododendron molle]
MADHGGDGDSGDIIDRPEDVGGPMAAETDDQTNTEATVDEGATVASGGNDVQGHQQEVAGEDVRCATEEEPRATVEISPVGPGVEPEGLGTGVGEGSVTASGNLGDASGSGARGDDNEASQTLSRDSAKGKSVVDAEAETTEDAAVEI